MREFDYKNLNQNLFKPEIIKNIDYGLNFSVEAGDWHDPTDPSRILS
jgi:hypothetical protein